jgi:hypothetical protein
VQTSDSEITDMITQDNNLITGDFNAHHQVWVSSNNRGKEIWTWVENTGLVLLIYYDGSPTRYKAYGSLSCLDLTLASPKILASLA